MTSSKGILVAIGLIAVATLLLSTNGQPQKSQFEEWRDYHGITYSSEYEQVYRKNIFAKNLIRIDLHNANPHRTYEMGLNQFSAMTDQEFALQYLGTKVIQPTFTPAQTQPAVMDAEVDWQSEGAVARVKSQGRCGADWAFHAVSGVEGLHFLEEGTLVSFSEQQLIDCASASKYGNQGCSGGLLESGYKYIADKGVVPEEEYPYMGEQQKCKNETGKYKIGGFVNLNGCNNLANALTERPISVAVDATNWSPYRSGIFSNCKTSLNHGLLLTGMSDSFWRLKNSWGSSWGEGGYIRISRGNTCGVCNVASYPYK